MEWPPVTGERVCVPCGGRSGQGETSDDARGAILAMVRGGAKLSGMRSMTSIV